MSDKTDPSLYWDRKILRWETSRYSKWLTIYPLAWTIRRRLRVSVRLILRRLPAGAGILELGCGSGRLAESLDRHYRQYVGMDFSGNAIAAARKRLAGQECIFFAQDVLVSDLPPADLTVFLGLTDWLSSEELATVLAKIGSKEILFSFTESRCASAPYRIYRSIMDRILRSKDYFARTYSESEIADLLSASGYRYEIVSAPRSFDPGTLVWGQRDGR